MAAENFIPDDLGDDFDDVSTLQAGEVDDNADDLGELLDGLGTDEEEVQTPPPAAGTPTDPPADPNAAPKAGAADTPPPADPNAAGDDTDWEPAPEPIANWKEIAEQNKLPVASEAQLREVLTLRQYVNEQFQSDPEAKQLWHLANGETAASSATRIERYLQGKLVEPFEDPDDPEVRDRIQGEMTSYLDDDKNLTPKGKRLDDHLKGQFANDLNKWASEREAQGRQQMVDQKTFVNSLQGKLKVAEGLTPAERREVFQFVRKGDLERIVDGIGEDGKPLSPGQVADNQADLAIWGNPKIRKILLDKRDADAYERGKSDGLKSLN